MNKVLLKSNIVRNNLQFLKTSKKNITGYFFTRGTPTSEILKGESVLVYEAPEWQEINKFLEGKDYYKTIPKDEQTIKQLYNTWQDCVFNTKFKAKYFGLLPFFVEDNKTMRAKKKFVLKMELFPEAKNVKFTFAMMSGKFYLNI
jgi:phosphopantothenoylcysteine synthetase/decarboxylase